MATFKAAKWLGAENAAIVINFDFPSAAKLYTLLTRHACADGTIAT